MTLFNQLKQRKTALVMCLFCAGVLVSPFVVAATVAATATNAVMNAKQLEYIWLDYETHRGEIDPLTGLGMAPVERTCVLSNPEKIMEFAERIRVMAFEPRSLIRLTPQASAGEAIHVTVRSKSGIVSAELSVHPYSQVFVNDWPNTEFTAPDGTFVILDEAAKEMWLGRADPRPIETLSEKEKTESR